MATDLKGMSQYRIYALQLLLYIHLFVASADL